MGRNTRFWFIGVFVFGLSFAGCKQEIKSDLPMTRLILNRHTITVEVANKAATRMTGLMFRRSMPQDQGMLFVFPDDTVRAFWMKNTQIPLNIAYIDDQGKIVNMLEMPPYSEEQFMSKGPAKYALEMNTGWFNRNGLKEGDQVEGVKTAPPATD